jgi:hypothetical protein
MTLCKQKLQAKARPNTTRLFLCKLNIYDGIYDDIRNAKQKFKNGGSYTEFWTCGNMVNILVGDVAYFMRVGDKNRGIFASGSVLSSPKDRVIKFQWNAVVDYDNPLLISNLLDKPEFIGANFAVRGSGYKLADQYANALDVAWQAHVDEFGVRSSGKACNPTSLKA